MKPTDANPNAGEYAARHMTQERPRRENEEEARRQSDLKAVADTVPGRRVLAWLLAKEKDAGRDFRGNSQDAYRLGRRHVGDELEELLKGILPRDVFLEIIFPKKEKEK